MELQALVEAGTVTSEALDAAFTHFLTPFPMPGCTAAPAHHQDRLLQLLVPHRVVSQALSQYLSGFIPPADGPDGAEGSSGIDISAWVRRRDPRCLQMHSRVRITRRAEACVAAACGVDLRDVAVTVGIPGVETIVSNTVHTPTPPALPAPASVPVAATTQLSDHQSPPYVRDATFTAEETRPFTEIHTWKQLANDVLASPVAAVSTLSGPDVSRDFMGMVFGNTDFSFLPTALCDLGVPLGVFNDPGQYLTPLMSAALKRDAATVKLCLDAGADPAVTNDVDEVAAHHAAQKGDLESLKLIAEVDHTTLCYCSPYIHSTPLHYAVEYGHLECVEFILAQGADPRVKDSVEVARNNGHVIAAVLTAALEAWA